MDNLIVTVKVTLRGTVYSSTVGCTSDCVALTKLDDKGKKQCVQGEAEAVLKHMKLKEFCDLSPIA